MANESFQKALADAAAAATKRGQVVTGYVWDDPHLRVQVASVKPKAKAQDRLL